MSHREDSLLEFVSSSFHMWFVFALTLVAVWAFVSEKFSIEVTCVAILTCLLIFGQVFPLENELGHNKLDSYNLLAGFANPSLIAVLALLVVGQGMIQTDALRPVTQMFLTDSKFWAKISLYSILVFTLVMSAFLNNTPVVVIAIPILQALASSVGMSDSRVMIPLSFAAILGGMTTLIGSSTNLLVSSAMVDLGYDAIGLFDFWKPGSIMAAVGLLYVMFILPKLLPDRGSMKDQLLGDDKEFIAEIDVGKNSVLIGAECVNGKFDIISDLKVRLIQRSGHLILPPFEGYKIEENDIVIVAANKSALANVLSKYPGFLLSKDEEASLSLRQQGSEENIEEEDKDNSPKVDELEEKVARSRILAEVMITPNSRMVEMSLDQAGFDKQFGVVVLGIQRRARVVRRRLGRIRLEAGDVLLVAGARGDIDAMREHSQNVIVLSGSKRELPATKKAPIAGVIFLATVASAAMGIITIPVAAITGAVLMIASGCLNVRQALRAIDRKIFLLVGAMLALGAAMSATGGDRYIAELMLQMPFENSPIMYVAILFVFVAVLTNVLSNNACAILFTPIAVNMAIDLGQDPFVFALTVIFAANCSFASPIGYKTNLLVMGPGHYRFKDFLKAGVPLMIIMWITYMFLAKYYFGLDGLDNLFSWR